MAYGSSKALTPRGGWRLRKIASVSLLLATLAWVQLSIAEHQFDHALNDTADYCDTCAKFDRLDDAVADEPTAGEAPPLILQTLARDSSQLLGRRHQRPTARGPPHA